MKTKLIAFILICFGSFSVRSQITLSDSMYRVYDGQGNAATLDDIVKAMAANDAVFLGEQHDDAVGHSIEAELFKRAVEKYSAQRRVALSMEMFERDVQTVVDEYLQGLISEPHFLLSSRPWPNYKTDYRPLVELAKEKHLDVVAANAPRRYVNMVSRSGRDSLNALSPQAKAWLAPLPYPEPSAAYRAKFAALMSGNTGDPAAMSGSANLIYSQDLWDATMGNSVAKYLKRHNRALVIQLNGSFHTEGRLGTFEQLMHYRPKTKAIVVTMESDNNFMTFDKAKHAGSGDFVILTAPRSVSSLREILNRVDLNFISLQSLKADIELTHYNSQLKESDILRGTASFLPERKFKHKMYLRLDWTSPTSEQLVVIGDTYALYRPRLNQVIEGKFAAENSTNSLKSPLSFLKMSKAQLLEAYVFNYLGQEKVSDVLSWHVEAVPKAATVFKSAEFWIDAGGTPLQLRINQKNGDSNTLKLSNMQKNVTLDGATFDLHIPKTVKRIIS